MHVQGFWFSFLTMKPRLGCCGVWRWVEHILLVHERYGFGTLLGPEGTPLVFLLAPDPGRLTHPVGGCGGGWCGLGCGCVLSVA